MRNILIRATFLLSFLLPLSLFSQTMIGGIINNQNEAVTAVNFGNNTVTVTSGGTFAIGDTVIIIQMKGADIDGTNSANFGNISAMNAAGKYELNIICDIQGNDITMERTLLNAYDPAGSVQVVGVPTYDEAQVSTQLDVNPWNGSTGGVFAIQVKNTFRLKGGTNFLLDGKGFRGGAHEVIADACGCGSSDPQYPDYFYPGPGNADAALKGEGIAEFISGKESGKGKQATGGGGGNDHNAGGAGGANYGAGGEGGEPCATRTCFFFGEYCRGYHPGHGGVAMSGQYTNAENRIFLGGGGGAGDDNNGTGRGGGNGAAIIIIIADSMVGNNGYIYNRGINVGNTSGDAGGGGGAGGTVILDVRAYHSSNIRIYVNGGRGSRSSWSDAGTTYNSKGKGGGGGGGVVWHRGASLPGNVIMDLTGGPKGYEVAATSPCYLDDGGATDGGAGGVVNNLVFPINASVWPTCGLLPLENVVFNAQPDGEDRVRLEWNTLYENNTAHFEVQRSEDGEHFEQIGKVQAAGQSNGSAYFYNDSAPVKGPNWYRLRQVDFDGKYGFTETRLVLMDHTQVFIESIYPNPVKATEQLNIRVSASEDVNAQIVVRDLLGRVLIRENRPLNPGTNEVTLSVGNLATGSYFVELQTGTQKVVRKVVIAD